MSYTAFLREMNKAIQMNQHVNRKHIIRFKNQIEYRRCLAQIKKLKSSLSRLSSVQSISTINSLCCSLQSFRKLQKYKGILFIEEDIKIKIHDYYPKFPLSRPQGARGLPRIPWGVKEIKAPEAWKYSRGNRIKIGVIDTGIDASHPDIRPNIAGGVNVVQRSHSPDDDNGHGTHIAGTIAAANKTNGILGVSPRASIYAIKAFDHDGSAFVSDIIMGIDWCIRNSIDIINMSFGMKSSSPSLRDSIGKAYDAGVIVVASSGNDGLKDEIDYPAGYRQTIAVGATDKNRQIAKFSNHGKGINIYAPGDDIFSTWLNDGYNTISGTSMATSHVSGVIAMLLAKKKRVTTKGIKVLLKQTAVPLKSRTRSTVGEISAFKAIRPKVK